MPCVQVGTTGLRQIGANADLGLAVQDLQGAADAYSAVLALLGASAADRLAAASNRAACSLAQRNYSSTIQDCSLAFGLLTGHACHDVSDVHAWLASKQGAAAMCQYIAVIKARDHASSRSRKQRKEDIMISSVSTLHS